jgi:hypothetical protein
MAKRVSNTSSNHHGRERTRLTISRSSPPSARILTVLASIFASTSTTNGHPLNCQSAPPSFLCPSVDDQHDNHVTDGASLAGPSTYAQSPVVPTHKPKYRPKRSIPGSYSQGADGRYRKIDEWTFYGSTVCLVRPPLPLSLLHSLLLFFILTSSLLV